MFVYIDTTIDAEEILILKSKSAHRIIPFQSVKWWTDIGHTVEIFKLTACCINIYEEKTYFPFRVNQWKFLHHSNYACWVRILTIANCDNWTIAPYINFVDHSREMINFIYQLFWQKKVNILHDIDWLWQKTSWGQICTLSSDDKINNLVVPFCP